MSRSIRNRKSCPLSEREVELAGTLMIQTRQTFLGWERLRKRALCSGIAGGWSKGPNGAGVERGLLFWWGLIRPGEPFVVKVTECFGRRRGLLGWCGGFWLG